jgi:hypothetical protein
MRRQVSPRIRMLRCTGSARSDFQSATSKVTALCLYYFDPVNAAALGA